MNVGFIGAGAMAQSIAHHAINAGHRVMLSNSRGPNCLISLSNQLGCQTGTTHQAAEFGDIVVLAIPLGAFKNLPQEPLTGKIVIDLLNYFPHRDGKIPHLQEDKVTTSELIAQHLHDAHLVKAINAITVEDLRRDAKPSNSLSRRALPIAGDHQAAKQIVSNFINGLGFDTVDGGSLELSWKFERFRPAYCVAYRKSQLEKVLEETCRNTIVPDGYWLKNRYI